MRLRLPATVVGLWLLAGMSSIVLSLASDADEPRAGQIRPELETTINRITVHLGTRQY